MKQAEILGYIVAADESQKIIFEIISPDTGRTVSDQKEAQVHGTFKK